MVVRTPRLVYIYFSIVSKQMNVNQGFSSFSLSQYWCIGKVDYVGLYGC